MDKKQLIQYYQREMELLSWATLISLVGIIYSAVRLFMEEDGTLQARHSLFGLFFCLCFFIVRVEFRKVEKERAKIEKD